MQMVGGPRFLETRCPRESKVGTTADPRTGATLLVQVVVHSSVVLCCAGVRYVTDGAVPTTFDVV